jgi:hypothetical protein
MSLEILTELIELTEKALMIVDNLFPAISTQSAVVVKVKSFAFMNDYTYVRFVWLTRPKNSDRTFKPYRLKNATTGELLLSSNGLPILSSDGIELYNIYRDYGIDSSNDPLFKNVNMSVTSRAQGPTLEEEEEEQPPLPESHSE